MVTFVKGKNNIHNQTFSETHEQVHYIYASVYLPKPLGTGRGWSKGQGIAI